MRKMFVTLVAIAASGFGCIATAGSGAYDNLSTQAVLKRFFAIKAQKGVTMIEYSLIAALITLVALLLLTQAGEEVQAFFTRMITALTGAAAAGSGT